MANKENLASVQLPTEHTVQLASRDNLPMVSDILASAFSKDPVMGWLCGRPEIYSDLFRLEAESLYYRHRHVFINAEKTGAAMWLPAGISAKLSVHWRLLPTFWKLVTQGGLTSVKRVMHLDSLFSKNHLKEPHFYLHSIGAMAGNQGRGIGSALLKEGLKYCDRAGMPAYLESSNEKNNPLYQRFGFVITGEERLPDDGPPVWFMRREARMDSVSR